MAVTSSGTGEMPVERSRSARARSGPRRRDRPGAGPRRCTDRLRGRDGAACTTGGVPGAQARRPRPRGAGDGGVGQLVVVVNDDLVRGIDIPAEVIERVAKREPRSRLDANAFTG